MNSIQTSALIKPELISAVPKKDETKGICQKFKDAFVSIYNMPLEVKVLGVVGAVCAVGSAACIAGMAFAPSVSSSSDGSPKWKVGNETVFSRFKDDLPNTVLTSENMYLSTLNKISTYRDCEIGGKYFDGSGQYMEFVNNSTMNSPDGNPKNYDLRAMIYNRKEIKCDIVAASLCRDINYDDDNDAEGSGNGDSTHVITPYSSRKVKVDNECNVYDFTSTIELSVHDEYTSSDMLNCIKTDGTLAEFLNSLAEMAKNVMDKSVNKEASKAQLERVAEEYENALPNLGIREAILISTGKFANEDPIVQDKIREGLLIAGVALSSISALALVSSGILAGVSCAKSKAAVHYNMEGHSFSVIIGGKKTYLELYDPCLKTKFTEQMLKALRHLLFYGADLGESYEMVIETADKVDKILEHNAVGTHMVFEAQQWLHKNYQTRFTKYREYVGLDFTPRYQNTATSAV